MQVSEGQISSYVETLETEKELNAKAADVAIAAAQAATEQKQKDLSAVKNIEADEKFANYTGPEKSKVGVNDQYYDANDVPKMSLVPEKQKSESFETLHAPNFGVDNAMISSPGTPGSLASAIDQKNADNEQLVADAKIHEAAKVGEQLKEAWKEGVISSFGNKDDVVKNAAIDEFANSRNGDDISILDQALNNEILNIITIIPTYKE